MQKDKERLNEQLQTSVLRAQASRQGSASQALAECQALLQRRQQQLEELQQKQELSQLLCQALPVPIVGMYPAEELGALVDRLRQERQQLLQRLLEANEQISGLHDELGPALLRGSPIRVRPSSSAARASALRGLLQLPGGEVEGSLLGSAQDSSPQGSSSGIGQQLSAAVGELSSRTQAVQAARSAALAELQELREAYRELQQQHGTLQAKHQLLQEEHCQLLSRQLGVTSDRSSLRQQHLSTEEQLRAALKQVMDQNFRLKLELVGKAEALRRAAAEGAGLQAGLPSSAALHSLEAKNQVLLQVRHVCALQLQMHARQLKQQLSIGADSAEGG
ncbi:hypothetical protein COO60DRAFT_1458451 [Scenedesmus sp. NREL 46B-D3]|nr:hypothetical protein COO60DRAFT_1458451 [Scenedesmus sp. NREL 46B-D3]